MRKKVTRTSMDILIFNGVSYTAIVFMSVCCLFPFLLLLSGSVTLEDIIITRGYQLIPETFSLDAYKLIFAFPAKLFNAYTITVIITLAGTVAGLFLVSMTAFVLHRRDFPYRNQFAFFFYFTTLFSGGLISYYILMVRYLGLKNNILALILPGLLPVFYILIMRNFITSTIPEALIESAKVDGAGDFYTFCAIVLPLLKPALASIGLFYALGYWNDWGNAMLFISEEKLIPLQYMLYRLLAMAQSLAVSSESMKAVNKSMITIPNESFKLAMTVVSIGPIVLVYPFVQKYFISGITLGAVKG